MFKYSIFLLLILTSSINAQIADTYSSVADLAHCYRVRNQQGSCVHCSTVMQLRWLGLYDVAEEWRRRYKNGEVPSRHKRKMDEMGLQYVMTTNGDEQILEYALSSRRGAGVTWGGNHCVYLVGRINYGGQLYAVIIDNNSPGKFKFQLWDRFLREWRNCSGWAFVILSGSVPPPIPMINQYIIN